MAVKGRCRSLYANEAECPTNARAVSNDKAGSSRIRYGSGVSHHHHYLHLSLHHEGRWDTTDDFATSFLHFPLFSTSLWDLANSRPVHSLMLSSQLFFCLPCPLPPFIVPCKMVLARPGEQEITPYYFSLHLFTMVRRSSCHRLPAGSCHKLPCWQCGLCMRRIVSCSSTSFPLLVFFFAALL